MSKKASDYWIKRFLDLESASNAYGQDAFRQIEPAFDKAQRKIQAEIEAWYGRFANNNQITIDEARKYLSSAELKELKWDVQEYIKYGRENDLNQMWMKELENASAKYHISRLEALKLRTQHAAEVAFGNELDEIDAMARKVFSEDYYHSIFEVQKGFNIGWGIGQIDERKLNKLITKPWAADGKNFSDRIWEQKTQLVDELHTQLTRTCILGKAPDDAIKAISKKFNVTKNQAGRLVMTEQAYFHSVAQQEAFKDLGVEEFEIVATLDSHTSEICQEMDGKHFPMKDYQPGVTAPPFHVWCRSVTVPYFEDNFTGERAARDENGKTYYVPDNMTYKDWKKSMVDGKTDDLTVVSSNDTMKMVTQVDEQPTIVEEVPIEDNRDFKELSLEEFKGMHHSISGEERKIVYGKSHFSGYINSSNARKLNDIIRQGGQLPSDYQEIADTLQSIIDKNSLPDDIMVTRYVAGDALESLVGVKMPTATFKMKAEEFFAKLNELPDLIQKGHIYTEKAFLSTSGVFDKNVMKGKPIMMKIKAPKGTPCYITTNYKESEIIFGQNTKLKVLGSYIENSGTSDFKVVLECIIV